MTSRLPFHSQLSSIMETMARSVLSQVCKLVDEDSTELRSELSRLMTANSALAERVNTLQCELTVVRSDADKLCKSYHSLGVQTACDRDGDAHDISSVSGSPTIEGIFGKDWCMNLWKDRDPYTMETVPDSPVSSEKVRERFTEVLSNHQSKLKIHLKQITTFEKLYPGKSVVTLPDQITVTEIKEEDYAEDAASSGHRETLSTEEHDESMAEGAEQLSVDFTADGSTCSLSCDQDREAAVSAGSIEEPPMQLISINDTEEAFSTHIIPIEDDEDEDEDEDEEDDDVQFVEESQQEPTMNAAGVQSHNKQLTSSSNNSENSSALDKASHDDCNMLNVQTTRHPNREKFTCRICSRTFFHKGTLTRHMKSHKSNFCSICKQNFPHRNKLNLHTCVPPVPTKRVSKSCELCGKTFANPSALRIHYVVHTGEKPYRCSLCGKRFTQKGNLKCHLRIHTGERPFCCIRCGKTFTQKVNLNHHLMAHRNQEVVEEKPRATRHLKNLMDKNCQ